MAASDSDNDHCLSRAAQGDLTARAQLLDQHRSRLIRMVTLRLDKRLSRRIDPSDVIQETLIEANRKLDDYLKEQPIPFYPWLRQLAWDQLVTAMRRHVYTSARSTNREEAHDLNLSGQSVAELATRLLDGSLDPLSKLLRAEAHTRLHDAIGRLPPIDREILVLRYLEQLSTSEIVAVLNIGMSAVKMRQLRALERLRELLGNQTSDPSE